MAEAAAEVEHAAADADPSPRGAVRISAAPGMAYALVAPFAGLARERVPGIRLEIMSTTRYVDLVRREADLALRWASPARRDTQRDLVVVATVEHAVGVYAAPSYIATLPRGYALRDLAWIGWCPPFEQLAPNAQLAALIPGFSPAFGSDDYLIQLRAAEAGVGAIVLASFHYRLAPPTRLVELDVGPRVPPTRTQLVTTRSSLAVPRIAAVAGLLAHELATTARRGRAAPRAK